MLFFLFFEFSECNARIDFESFHVLILDVCGFECLGRISRQNLPICVPTLPFLREEFRKTTVKINYLVLVLFLLVDSNFFEEI